MPGQPASTRANTAEEILDRAETLIQTRGYSAFSYQDIADALGIRKASIHYHYPSKADLGSAVVDRYARRFEAMLHDAAADPDRRSMAMLDLYLTPYRALAGTADRVCLCGALAGEMPALPEALRARVDVFFREHQAWLAGIVERGRRRGEFAVDAEPERYARMMFGALQGALLVKRTTGDASQLEDVVAVLKRQLAGG